MCSTTENGTTNRGPDPKIIDILKEKEGNNEPNISLEYFPPRTETGVKNLYARMDRMLKTCRPLFTDVTWGAGGSTADLTMEIVKHAHNHGHVANMHLTCTNMEKDGDPIKAVKDALQEAHDAGIRNIVALRGDPPEGQDEWTATEGGFTCALDLVKFIRKEYGADFGISVAGYPEGHPNAITEVKDTSTMTEAEKGRSSNFDGVTYTCLDADYKKEMDYLKEKVDAGADLIITQMFFDVEIFKTFVKDCREWGIMCPILPGLMCINAYAGFKKMTKFCKTRVPEFLEKKMDEIKDDADAVKAYGIQFGTEVCQEIIKSGASNVLHFYTLNLEKVVYGVMDGMGISTNALSSTNEADAKDMVAVGSAWARVGDNVKSIYGKGVVRDIRKVNDITTCVVESDSWIMAGGQRPIFYLQPGQFEKVF